MVSVVLVHKLSSDTFLLQLLRQYIDSRRSTTIYSKPRRKSVFLQRRCRLQRPSLVLGHVGRSTGSRTLGLRVAPKWRHFLPSAVCSALTAQGKVLQRRRLPTLLHVLRLPKTWLLISTLRCDQRVAQKATAFPQSARSCGTRPYARTYAFLLYVLRPNRRV